MQTTKLKFDPNSPEIKAYQDDLAHQFVREGTMVAFPTCLPGMTTPITHDESRITALDINADGHVYGGTSGRQAHLFGAAFHGLTGVVLDAGIVAGATSTVAVCCGPSGGAIAFVNGAQGGRAVSVPHLDLRQDWIQEWGLEPVPLKDLGECVRGRGCGSRGRGAGGKYRRRCHDAAPVYRRFRIGTYYGRRRSAGSRSTRRESRRSLRTR